MAQVNAEIASDLDRRAAIVERGGSQAENHLLVQLNFGFDLLENMLGTVLSEGGDAWLSGQVTATWTAFEALSEELWETALNLHPQRLCGLSGKRDKSVELWMLQKHGYDLSQSMGTVLKTKYGFDSLDGIRAGYADAFSDDAVDIQKMLTDKSLDALALVRNVIVHNGGVIDEPYLRRKSALPSGAIGSLGDSINLDGPLVSELITRPLQICGDLIVAVDSWLSEH